MNLKKITKILTASLVIILLASFSLFFGLKNIEAGAKQHQTRLLTEYNLTQKPDSLWKAAVIWPQKDILRLLGNHLIKAGDCNEAYFINKVVNQPSYTQITECQIESRNITTEAELSNRLTPKEKDEFITFMSMARGDFNIQTEPNPSTNLGKLTQMIIEKDFTDIKPRTLLLTQLNNNVQNSHNKKEGLLIASRVFNSYGFPHLSIYLTNEVISSSQCISEAYLIQAESYRIINNNKKALAVLQEFLNCDPVNVTALEEIIKLQDELSITNSSYQERLEELNKLDS